MNKIILIDLDLNLVNSIYTSNIISIHTLIVSTDKQKEEISSKFFLNNVLSMESINYFYKNNNMGLDYSMIKQFIGTQLKVEHFFSRVTSDLNSIQYIYYHALSYWNNIFQNEEISGVFYLGLEFGSTFDTVIFDVAKYYDKKVYLIEYGLFSGTTYANQILDYNNGQYIRLNSEALGLRKVERNNFLYNSKDENPIQKPTNFKELLKKFPEKYGGYLLIMFFALVLGKYKDTHHTFSNTWWKYFKNYLYTKKLLRHYKSLSVEFDKNKKYVFYAMHMEPEAGTLARTTFSNQLVIIKSLAQSLPEGWVLYVKEHPHQFRDLNNFYRYYYLSTIDKFKTKNYYDEIIKIPNVFLLDINQSSQKVITSAKAVSTINGTIMLEGIIERKPIISFSQGTTPLVQNKEVFDIENDSDLKNIMNTIESGFQPNYNDFEEILNEYYYEVKLNESTNYKLLFEFLINV